MPPQIRFLCSHTTLQMSLILYFYTLECIRQVLLMFNQRISDLKLSSAFSFIQ